MKAHLASDEALVKRLLPSANPDAADRAQAWAEWCSGRGMQAVLRFIRLKNSTDELDQDLLQDALLTAYVEVERGRYTPRTGVPFAAYVKGIARNKIREARRRERGQVSFDDLALADPHPLEGAVEQRAQREVLRRGLAQLPARQRQVLECYLGGESMAEIASRMAMTEELARQCKCRGLRCLQRSVNTIKA